MLFAPLVSTVSIRSFRRVGQRVGPVSYTHLPPRQRSDDQDKPGEV